MRIFLLIFCISIFSGTAIAQRYAVIDGLWTGPIWATTPGGVAGTAATPTATDDVYTNGHVITVDGGGTCRNLAVTYNVANGLTFISGTITVTGSMFGYNNGSSALVGPTVNTLSGTSLFLFTGANWDGFGGNLFANEVISYWNKNTPIVRASFTLASGTQFTIDNDASNSIAISQFLVQGSSDLATNFLNFPISPAGTGLEVSTTFAVAATASFETEVPIRGGAGSASLISSTGIGGTFITNSYFNSIAFNISGTGIFRTAFNGADNTEGWWYQTARPTSGAANATSTIVFDAAADQNVYAMSYGNLTLANSGTKTLVGSGTLTVAGNLTISSSSVTFNSNSAGAINIGGNLANSGIWTPTDPVVFNGAAAQSFPGTLPVIFNGGFEVSKSAGTLTLNRAIITVGFVVDASSTFDLGSSIVTLQGGDINNNGTITASPGTSAIVVNGVSTVLGSSSTSLNNFLITGTGNFTAPAGSINIGGNFTNNGIFNNNSGTLVFNGGTGQSIAGSSVTTFSNITIANSSIGGVVIESNQNLRGVLTLGASAIFDADGSADDKIFTILSNADDPTQDGAIAAIPTTATLSGNVTVQRYMSLEGNDGTGAGRIYRYISSPVTGASVSDLQVEIPVTGSFTGASSCSGCASGSQSMFRYNESVLGGIGLGYEDFPSGANTETFTPGQGYSVYVRGNLLTGNARFDLRGTVTKGDQSLGVTYASSGVAADDGWNLVGNPYASTIDWDALGWAKTNVSGGIYFRNNGSGTIASYVGGSGVNGGSRYIPSGQAFWVQTTAGSPLLQATEAVKAPGQVTTFFRESSPTDLVRITLASATASDETLIHFKDGATDNFDANADARKLKNTIFNLSSLASDQSDLAINSMSALACGSEKSIQLSVTNIAAGNYSLNFSEFESFPDYVGILLHDKYTDGTINIRESAQYSFDITAANQSLTADRFTITFLPDVASIATAPDHCLGTKSKPFIEIKGSKNGVQYVATIDGIDISEKVSGNGNDIILPINPSSLSAGKNDISLMSVIAACGFSTDQTVELILNDQIAITGTEASSACREGSVQLKAFGSPETGSYNWYENESDVALEHHESSFTTSVLTTSQTYYVAVVSPQGCEGERVSVLAEVVQYEDAVITAVGTDLLQSNYAEGNTWYLNGEKIPGATSRTYSPQSSGTYAVEVQINGCSTSAEHVFVITASEQSLNSGISLYPNPVEEKAYVDVLKNNEDIRGIVLYNNIGKMLTEVTWVTEADKTRGIVDMKNLPSGVYIMKVSTSDRIVSLRIHKK